MSEAVFVAKADGVESVVEAHRLAYDLVLLDFAF